MGWMFLRVSILYLGVLLLVQTLIFVEIQASLVRQGPTIVQLFETGLRSGICSELLEQDYFNIHVAACVPDTWSVLADEAKHAVKRRMHWFAR